MKRISIWTEPLPESFRWNPDNFVGGTHEMVVEFSSELVKLGFEVSVYYDGDSGEWNGVYFLPRAAYSPEEIVLAMNSHPPVKSCVTKRNIYYTTLYDDREERHSDFDERLVISKYHQGIFGEQSRILSPACHTELFQGGIKENICLYSSSPDGGGKFLASIWPEVKEKTGYELVMTYGSGLSESEMVKLYKKAKFWLHPAQRIELFCISGYKAQAAGCWPIYVPEMALAETVRYGTKTSLKDFKDDLISAILSQPEAPRLRLADWSDRTKELLAYF